MRPPRHLFTFILAIALGVSGSHAAGVAVLKEQTFHRDSSAVAVAYSKIIDSHGPYLRLVSDGVNVDVTRSKLIERIELPAAIPQSIHEEEDLTSTRQILADLTRFAARYPRSKPLLESTITGLTAHVDRYDAGEVRLEGTWISRATCSDIMESRRREDEALRLVGVEKRVFEANQRNKGLVLQDGKWMTNEEVGKLPPDSPTELSESVAPVWNGELQGARFALDNLARLAATQTGAPKVRTERLATAVRNLFTAEARLTNQMIARTSQTQAAAIHDQNAKNWLKPNAFGTINKDAARASTAKAAQVRKRSNEELDTRRQALLAQLRETEIVSGDFKKLRELRVALILNAAVRTVAARHFSENEFTPSTPVELHASVSKHDRSGDPEDSP